MKSFACRTLLFFAVIMSAVSAGAHADEVAGSRDPQFLPRLEGLTIGSYDARDYDAYVVPCGPLLKRQLDKFVKVEGRVTRILYNAHPRKSVFEISKYYENSLKKQGFEILYSSADDELTGEWGGMFYKDKYDVQNAKEHRFLSAKRSSKEGDTYVTVYATLGWRSYATTEVDVIEPATGPDQQAAAPVRPVSEPAAVLTSALPAPDTSLKLEGKLKAGGSVNVKTITFKEGSAEINPVSEAALKDMAAIVKRNAGKQFEIQVYTDSIGTPEYCKQLSEKRAENVLRSVVLVHGADRARVKASGLGYAPEAGAEESGYANRVIFSMK